MSSTLESELNKIKNDKVLTDLLVKSTCQQMADSLKGEMGQDMIDVLEGKKKVGFTWWQRFIYRVKVFLGINERF